MKHYQDTLTGQKYDFDDNIDVEKLMQTNRNLPKTLTDNIKEKPSDNHIWHNGDWIDKKDKPMDYKEPISELPVYNPAWITFLFEEGTLLFNEEIKFQFTLDQINNNSYNGQELSKVITTLPNYDENSKLPILVTVDGSIILPVNESYNTKEIAVNKFNEIISALFLGGLKINAIHLGDLEQGTLLEGGKYGFSYISSSYNRLRNNWASMTELSVLLNRKYIAIEKVINAYAFGMDVLKNISFSAIYLVQGYHSMQLWKTADALSNLWIVVEQLTNIMIRNLTESEKNSIFQQLNITQAQKIHMKHKVLKTGNIISESCYDVLDKARDQRNDLVHEGKLPDHDLVERLWIFLFEMFEVSNDEKLNELFEMTVDRQLNKVIRFRSNDYENAINLENTNFEEWASTITKQTLHNER